jgi:hypothetical protein
VLLLVLFQLSVGIASFVIRGNGSTALDVVASATWTGLYNGQQFERNQLLEIENGVCLSFGVSLVVRD